MASNTHTPGATPEIRALLAGLRRRIRAYVWLEGVASILIWLGLTFWLLFALDYFPVLVWASELPRGVRLVGLAVVAGVALVILYRMILRRTFVRLRDRSMAVLLERAYPEFGDALLTSVELPLSGDVAFDAAMFAATRRRALEQLPRVRLGKVFRTGPLLTKVSGAVLLVLSVVVFASARDDMFRLGVERLYLLNDTPWPRHARIEIVGIEVERISPRTGELMYSEILPFRDGEVKVARGANVALRVRASTQAPAVPETCRILYRTQEGSRGQVSMRRDGSPRDGFQYYSFTGKPFQGILDTLVFDVIGYDHRVRNQTVRVVETPAVIETDLDCTFPDYLVDREQDLWLPRTIRYRSRGTQLPQGTRVVIRMKSNKPLVRVELSEPGSGASETLDLEGTSDTVEFAYTVEHLDGSFALDVSLRDTDNVLSEAPHRVFLSAVTDEPPAVDVRMRGIGSAVTPDVIIPVAGTIRDDHALAEAWFEFQIGSQAPQKKIVAVPADGELATALDFRELRLANSGVALTPGDRLIVALRASDRFNLHGGPNVGSSERLDLEVVTPDEFLIRLDRRELAERRRFEHILEEMTQMRDSLIRVQNEIEGISPALDPLERAKADEASAAAADTSAQPEARIDLRSLRVQQAQRQSQKSAAEVLGVASAFRAIREELENNRIDAEDRKSRLKEKVADPLQRIGSEMFPELDRRLLALEKAVTLKQDEATAADEAVAQTNEVLVQLNKVLDDMLDIESYNELVEIVRTLIDDQQRLIDETKKARKKEALELLK